jgi:hypothetical protein
MNKLDHDIQHAAGWLDKPAQQANSKSAQPCGCDAGADYLCQWHYDETHPGNKGVDEEADVNDAKVISFEDSEYPDVAYYRKMHGPVGIGGAPTRATTLPTDGAARKQYPVASGVLDYFPDALVALAHVSWLGNEQHNPGKPLHWDRSKSGDESDTMIRHFLQRGTLDTDGTRHSAKLAWRALAILQKELEQEKV